MTKTELRAHQRACELAAERLRAVTRGKPLPGECFYAIHAEAEDLIAEADACEAEIHRREGNEPLARLCGKFAVEARTRAANDREQAEAFALRRAA